MNSQQNLFSKGDILVVDDTPDNLRLLTTMLTDQGYQVRKVINGELALKVASKDNLDLVLLDLMMPKINGFEVCQHLKANNKTRNI